MESDLFKPTGVCVVRGDPVPLCPGFAHRASEEQDANVFDSCVVRIFGPFAPTSAADE
ncbi:hypothetical protein D3C81_1894270 [compost metagenome]